MVCATSKDSDQSAHMHSGIRAFAKLQNKQHLEFLSLKGGCAGSSESIHVKKATLLEITCRGSIISSRRGGQGGIDYGTDPVGSSMLLSCVHG